MGNIYTQLSLHERTMIHTQLGEGPYPGSDCPGAESFGLDAVSRTPSKRLDSPDDASRGPGRPPLCRRLPRRGGPHARPGLYGHPACGAPPATRYRVMGPGHPLPEGRLLARADCWYTGGCASGYALAAGVARNHLHRHPRHAPWCLANGRDRLAALRPCQTAPPSARRRPAGTDS